jgi:hypothetical protein
VAAFQVPTSLVPLAAATWYFRTFKNILKNFLLKNLVFEKKNCFENFQHYKKIT